MGFAVLCMIIIGNQKEKSFKSEEIKKAAKNIRCFRHWERRPSQNIEGVALKHLQGFLLSTLCRRAVLRANGTSLPLHPWPIETHIVRSFAKVFDLTFFKKQVDLGHHFCCAGAGFAVCPIKQWVGNAPGLPITAYFIYIWLHYGKLFPHWKDSHKRGLARLWRKLHHPPLADKPSRQLSFPVVL